MKIRCRLTGSKVGVELGKKGLEALSLILASKQLLFEELESLCHPGCSKLEELFKLEVGELAEVRGDC